MMAQMSENDNNDAEMRALRQSGLSSEFDGDRTSQSNGSNGDGAGPIERQPSTSASSTAASTTTRPVGRPPRQLNINSDDPDVRRRDEIALRQRERRLEEKEKVQSLQDKNTTYKNENQQLQSQNQQLQSYTQQLQSYIQQLQSQNQQLQSQNQQLENEVRRMQERQSGQDLINTELIMSLTRDLDAKEAARLNLESYHMRAIAQMEQTQLELQRQVEQKQTQLELQRQVEQGQAQLDHHHAQQGKGVGGDDDQGTAT